VYTTSPPSLSLSLSSSLRGYIVEDDVSQLYIQENRAFGCIDDDVYAKQGHFDATVESTASSKSNVSADS
jgi:hypothetical protein